MPRGSTRIFNASSRQLFFALFLLFSIQGKASAVELPSINKSKIRLSIPPGRTGYGEIIVENTTPEPRQMRVYLEGWRYLPAADGTKEFSPAEINTSSAVPWIRFSPSEFTLAPFSRQKVNYSVNVPEGASGGHYAAMFFESLFGRMEEAQKEFSAGMNIVIRVATLFYIEPEGTITRKALIDNLKVAPAGQGASRIEMDFKNTGNVDITCGGTFAVMDKAGMVYARGEFNDVYTFPGDAAGLSAACRERISKGIYDLILTFDLGKALETDKFSRPAPVTRESGIEVLDDGRIVLLSSG